MTQRFFNDWGTQQQPVIQTPDLSEEQDISFVKTGLLGNSTSVRTLREELIARHFSTARERSADAAALAGDMQHLLGEIQALYTQREALLRLPTGSAAEAQKLAVLDEEMAVRREDYQGLRAFYDLLNQEARLHQQAALRLRRQTLT